MENAWILAFGMLVAAYALSSVIEMSWALWMAVATSVPVVLMMCTDGMPGL